MENFPGTYKHTKTENFDKFLEEIGIPKIFRMAMCSSNPTMKVTHKAAEDKWNIGMKMAIKTMEYNFKMGETVEGPGLGRKTKNVFTIEGSSIKQIQTSDKYVIEVTREFSPEGAIMKMKNTKTGTTATRHFKRI